MSFQCNPCFLWTSTKIFVFFRAIRGSLCILFQLCEAAIAPRSGMNNRRADGGHLDHQQSIVSYRNKNYQHHVRRLRGIDCLFSLFRVFCGLPQKIFVSFRAIRGSYNVDSILRIFGSFASMLRHSCTCTRARVRFCPSARSVSNITDESVQSTLRS